MSPSRGTWLGLTASGFLVGIAIHSVIPYQQIPTVVFSILAVVACVLIFSSMKKPSVRWIGLILLACLLGLWRFEAARLSLPSGLKPFSSQGLAHVRAAQAPSSQQSLEHWMWVRRNNLRTRGNAIFSKDSSALLRGILYGERDLSKEWNTRFRRAGLLHIIAVSGSNMTIIVVITMFALLGIGCSRKQAFFLLTGILVLFVLFVQPSASVVRAACMGWLFGLAPLVGRIPRASRLLLVAAVIFVAWKPWALFYDAGFALSFLAMSGLLTWSAYFDKRLEKRLPWEHVREVVTATLGATMMTMPYLAWAFGQLSLFGLVSSLIVVPLVPWVMATGTLALLLPQLPIVVLVAEGFLQVVLQIARFTDSLPPFLWKSISVPFWAMLVAYYLLATWWSYAQKTIKHYPQFEMPKR